MLFLKNLGGTCLVVLWFLSIIKIMMAILKTFAITSGSSRTRPSKEV